MNVETIDSLIAQGGGLLWRASWQGGLVLLAVWLIARTFRTLPPVVVSWLWRLAYLKLLVCLIWTTPVELPVLGIAPPRPAVKNTVINLPRIDEAMIEVPGGGVRPAAPVLTSPRVFPWTRWLALLWLSGSMLVAVSYGRQWWRLRAWRQRATPLRDPVWLSTLDQLTVQFGIRSRPQLKHSKKDWQL